MQDCDQGDTMRKRTAAAIGLLVAVVGCGDASFDDGFGVAGGAGGDVGDPRGERVHCDEIEVIERGEGSFIRYFKAVYPGVEEGTASFRFCDFWNINNGSYSESEPDCTESDDPFPGFYRDGDLHVVCSELDVDDAWSLEIGAGRIYVRFGDGDGQ